MRKQARPFEELMVWYTKQYRATARDCPHKRVPDTSHKAPWSNVYEAALLREEVINLYRTVKSLSPIPIIDD